MKIKSVVSITTFLMVILVGSYAYSSTEPDGFRGLKWGTEFSPSLGMLWLRDDSSYGGIKVYRKAGEELKIGGADIKSIEYGFWNGKLCNVSVHVERYVNWEALKAACSEKFGHMYQDNQFVEMYTWPTWITSGGIMQYNQISKEGILYLSDASADAEMTKFEQNKAKQGAEKDF